MTGEIAQLAGESSDRRGRDRLVSWIARHRADRADAEDLLHEAYIRYQQSKRLYPVGNPTGFVLQVAARLAIDAHRKRRYLVSPPFEVVCAAHADSAPPVEDVLASRERLRRVWEGLETLSERTREVFVMHRLEGRKYHEIAAALGISCSAVEKHMAKADLFLMRWVEGW